VLAALTVANLASAEAMAAARLALLQLDRTRTTLPAFLILEFRCGPTGELRAALAGSRTGARLFATGPGCRPVDCSRGGFLAALVALAEVRCCFAQATRAMMAAAFVLPVIAFVLWFGVPMRHLND